MNPQTEPEKAAGIPDRLISSPIQHRLVDFERVVPYKAQVAARWLLALQPFSTIQLVGRLPEQIESAQATPGERY